MKAFAPFAAALLLFVPAWSLPDQVVDKGPAKSTIKSIKNVPAIVTDVDGRTFAEWKADLTHADPSVRTKGILAITLFGSRTTEAVPLLLERCRDSDASPRVKAVMALSFIDIAEKDIPKVIDALAVRAGNDTQSIIRYHAAVALEHRFAEHAHARNAVGGLLKGASDLTWEIRRACLAALRQCGVDKNEGPELRVTHAMMRALQDSAADVRLEGAHGLGAMGRPTDPVLLDQVERALLAVVRDRNKSVGIWAQVSIMALADKVKDTQLETLAKGLSSADARIRAQTTRAIGALRDRAKPCLAALLKALQDKERIVIVEACNALVYVGDKGPKVMEALTELSKNKEVEESVRESAKNALEELAKPKKK